MTELIATLVGDLWPILVAIAAALGWGFHQRLAGARAERAKADKARLESINAKKEIRDEVDSLGPADLDTRFDRWVSDDKR